MLYGARTLREKPQIKPKSTFRWRSEAALADGHQRNHIPFASGSVQQFVRLHFLKKYVINDKFGTWSNGRGAEDNIFTRYQLASSRPRVNKRTLST